jgi:hypothetical protein
LGFFSKTGRFLAYPIIRPLEQMRDSSAQVRGDYANLKAIKEKRRAQIEEQRIAYKGKVFDVLGEAFAEEPLRKLLIDIIIKII